MAGEHAHGMDSLRAALGHEGSPGGAHEGRVEPASLTGDELRMGHHRVADPLERAAERGVLATGWIREARIGERQAMERQAEGDDTAAVRSRLDGIHSHAGQPGDRLERELLDGALGMPVALDFPAGRLGVERHPGVLPGAVVAERRQRLAIAQQTLRGLEVVWRVDAALQDVARQSALAEEGLDGANVPILARVAGGHDRQRLGRIAEAVAVESAGRHERGELKRLRRGSQEDERVGIAGGGNERAVSTNDGNAAAVTGLHGPATGYLDEDRWHRTAAPAYHRGGRRGTTGRRATGPGQ